MRLTLLCAAAIIVFSAQVLAKTVDPVDFGATVNDETCDTDSIQAAVNDVKQSGGGTIAFPPGSLRLCGPIDVTAQGNYVSYEFSGTQGSEIEVSIGSYQVGFNVGNVNQFVVSNLVFTGLDVSNTDPAFVDARILFLFNYTMNVTIRNSQFNGLWCSDSIIRTMHADLTLRNTVFGGSIGGNGAVYAVDYRGVSIRDTTFIDYANHRNRYLSKTGGVAWINVENDRMPTVNAMSSQLVRVENCRFDEGASRAISLRNVPMALISGINVNVNGTDPGVGIYLDNVPMIDIEYSQFGYTQYPRPAIVAKNNTTVDVKKVKLGGGGCSRIGGCDKFNPPIVLPGSTNSRLMRPRIIPRFYHVGLS